MNNKWFDAEFEWYLNDLLLLQRQLDYFTFTKVDENEQRKYNAKINASKQKIYKRVTGLKTGQGF